MTSEQWLADYLEQGRPGWWEPEPDAPDVASADADRRLRALLAEPDSWAEPPAGLLDEILAGIDRERSAPAGATRPVAVPGPAAGRDGRRRTHIRRTVRAGAAALLAAAAIVIGLVVTRGPATNNVPWRVRGWLRERARPRSCTPPPPAWPSSWTSRDCRPPRRATTTRPG